jgi:ClpP class serine protease
MTGVLWLIIFVVVVVLALTPLVQRRRLLRRRRALIRGLEAARGSRVISMIHRQETVSLLGLPLSRFIDIEDSEQILRAIRLTPDEMPIDLVLHTPGGLVLASDQIAHALRRHPGKITVIVPHYAMSGGTLLALAADAIVMDRDAVLGPVDPQLGVFPRGYWPAASVLKALEVENANRDDQTLMLGDMAHKAITQVHDTVLELVSPGREPDDAERLATALSDGHWTHSYPIRFERAQELGLPVNIDVPDKVYELMRLFPQRARRPSVEFVPVPYREGDQDQGTNVDIGGRT